MRRGLEQGYILPAIIFIGLATSILEVTLMQITSSASQTLNAQSYTSIAEDAANAGIAYASSCISENESGWTQLTPTTDCMNGASGTNSYIVDSADLRSSFTVSAPMISGGQLTAASTGIVEQRSGSIWIPIASIVNKISLPYAPVSIPVSSGQSITDLSTETHSCAIANGKLYCWGHNIAGQLGLGDNTSRASPQLVAATSSGQAFYNKNVTKVAVGTWNTCAVADGDLYCWGDNDYGQIGDGTNAQRTTPQLVGGLLAGKKVTDISLTQGSLLDKSACAIANGVPYCWGSNSKQQLGQRPYDCGYIIPLTTIGPYCIPSLIPLIDTSDKKTPTPLYGYRVHTTPAFQAPLQSVESDSVLYQKKMTSIGVGASNGSTTTAGYYFSWGNLLFGSLVPEYPKQYTGDFAAKSVQPESITANEDISCGVANSTLVCNGLHLALTSPLGNGGPTQYLPVGDIQSHDGGSGTFILMPYLYCMVANGGVKCAGNSSSYTGTGYEGTANFQPLVTTADMQGKYATKIGVGKQFGCFIANGSLLCWGHGDQGQLGDGTLVSTSTYAKSVATGIIGTSSGAAATGAISVGTNHACGTANSRIYCWGSNNNGQLGTGNLISQDKPTAPTNSSGAVITKVSAGTNHTCAIANGTLFCWGSNANGKTGIGTNSGNQLIPAQVGGALAGKRVTEVSAGASGTCAIADGQAYCWGLNSNKQVGNGSTVEQTTPVPVSGSSNLITGVGKSVSSISMGTNHACAVMNGNGYCWGNQSNGRLGNNIQSNTDIDPVQVTLGTAGAPVANYITPAFTHISAGNGFTCAVINGTVSCWGISASGQTGTSATANIPIPTPLSGTAGTLQADAISAGETHACAVLEGRTYCWGSDANEQIGNGVTTGNQLAPVLIGGGDLTGKASIEISAGDTSTCSVANGTIQCWGADDDEQIGNGNATGNVSLPTTTNPYNNLIPTSKGPIY